MVEVIRFKKDQGGMAWCFDKSMLGTWHIIVPPLDYTACGHATDEYNSEKKEGLVTCHECLETIKFFKDLKKYKEVS